LLYVYILIATVKWYLYFLYLLVCLFLDWIRIYYIAYLNLNWVTIAYWVCTINWHVKVCIIPKTCVWTCYVISQGKVCKCITASYTTLYFHRNFLTDIIVVWRIRPCCRYIMISWCASITIGNIDSSTENSWHSTIDTIGCIQTQEIWCVCF
jgi:hypothetical protein